MTFRLKQSESVSKSIRRIASEQIEKAIKEIEDSNLSQAEKVHQVRKRCKKLRGLVRLVRPAMTDDFSYSNANGLFRKIAKPLSEARDSKIYLDSFDSLLARFVDANQQDRFQSIRDQLSYHREQLLGDDVDVATRLDDAQEHFKDAFQSVQSLRLDAKGYEAWSHGLGKTYCRGRTAFREAQSDPSIETLHEWRKRVKYHTYHCKLLRLLWPALIESRYGEGKRLGDWLGDHHDLAVLKQRITDSPSDYGNRDVTDAFVSMIDQRSAQLESHAFRLGKKMFAEKPKRFLKRYRRYWKSIQ
ncbi:CHAD domain-containing protein [Novipirellula caenicola]|uniref:CHAD domain-containing protein n=1 Tax=Novipirellula caenicola TaxID=1536901 RepID=A0ABP9VQ03_9BACT